MRTLLRELLTDQLLQLTQRINTHANINHLRTLQTIRSGHVGVRIVITSNRHDGINNLLKSASERKIKVSDTYNKKSAFQPVGFTISEEVSNHEDRQHQKNNHKDLKV